MTKSTSTNIFSTGNVYQFFLKPILSNDEGIDAEQLTEIALASLGQLSLRRNWPDAQWLLQKLTKELQRTDIRLEQKLFGSNFINPIGLAAGFDKNGVGAGIWNYFGFGFAELGTVTWHPQKGNTRPRLFRLAAEQAALNRMGFNNDGAEKMLRTLERQQLKQPGQRSEVIGLNLGKSKITSIEKAPSDYAASLELLSPLADYAVINVSSPNTPQLRDLQSPENLRQLIKRLKELPNCPPLLVKIAPDLKNEAIAELADVAIEEGLSGLIAVNTSLDRLGLENRVLTYSGIPLEREAGGLSGAPLRSRAIEVIRQLHKRTGSHLPLIGVGGIGSPQDAWERITAGASLVQIYTGWIFQGPNLVPLILEGLLSQLEKHGFHNISQAIGSDAPWL